MQSFSIFLLISILTVLLAMNFPVLWPLAFMAIGLTILDGILSVIGGSLKAVFGYLKEISPDDDSQVDVALMPESDDPVQDKIGDIKKALKIAGVIFIVLIIGALIVFIAGR